MQKITVSLLLADGEPIERREIELLGRMELRDLVSVRQPGAYKTQKHIPGYFWMEQTKDLLWYESRLEMMTLKTLDYERDIEWAVSQPFLLSFKWEGKNYTHVPDFLLILKDGTRLLVNAKPKRHLSSARSMRSFSACTYLAERLNWEYVTRSEPPPEYATNINWLNGYKRRPFALEKFRNELLDRAKQGLSIGFALRELEPTAFARPVLFYLMWSRQIGFDPTRVLADDTELWCGDAQ